MKNLSIAIKSIGVYHPQNVVGNEVFIEHFRKYDKDITELLNSFGRDKRYLSDDPKENTVTMSIEASKAALQKAEISGEEIDLLIFSSGTPEYLAPTNGLKVHNGIGGKSSAIVYDMNANCVGMIVAVEQASRYMLSNPEMKKALVVGAEQMNKFSQETDEVTRSSFGDAACAVILEKVESTESGFVDAVYYTNSDHTHDMLFPECGMSNIYNADISEQGKRIYWYGGSGGNGFAVVKAQIEALFERNHITAEDISGYFVSQVNRQNIMDLANAMGENFEKFTYIGDRFGYTGTSSPFIALNHAIETNKIKRGDSIIIWSVGTGVLAAGMLWKY